MSHNTDIPNIIEPPVVTDQNHTQDNRSRERRIEAIVRGTFQTMAQGMIQRGGQNLSTTQVILLAEIAANVAKPLNLQPHEHATFLVDVSQRIRYYSVTEDFLARVIDQYLVIYSGTLKRRLEKRIEWRMRQLVKEGEELPDKNRVIERVLGEF